MRALHTFTNRRFFEAASEDKKYRSELREKLQKYGQKYLFNELKLIDPEIADTMDETKHRRVIRALEVFYATGIRMSELQKEKAEINFATFQFGLSLERKYLYERINQRVDIMMQQGLISEVETLKKNGYHYRTHNSLNTVGIKEVFYYLEDKIDYETMLSLIKQNSRRYAKRQLTWFRKDERINWVEVNEESDSTQICNEIISKFK